MSLRQNFSVMCRTCLTESNEIKSLFVNFTEPQSTSLGNLLMSFTSIKLIEGDGLPEGICLNCVQTLDKVVSFRNLCEKSDETLRLWLATSQEFHKNNEKNDLFVRDAYQKEKEEENNVNSFTTTDFNSCRRDNQDDCKLAEETSFGSAEDEFRDEFNTRDVKVCNNSEDSGHRQEFHSEEYNNYNPAEHENSLYNCIECNENFTSLELYKNHTTSIHLITYTCEICGKMFKLETALKRHITAHSQTKNEDGVVKERAMKKKQKLPRTCTLCNKTFRFHSNLERHKLIHTGERPFLCNVCGKSFSQLSYLKIHSFIHTGEKPYKCQMCERSFAAPGTLMTHIRTHTGERPHVCKICGKDFPQSGYLSAHIRIHTGEKPAECTVCHRRFNQRGRLTVHMRMHSGEKPYTCRECGRSFAVKGTLKKHMRTHTGERPYICSICGQAFTQSGTLATHMKVHKPKLTM